MTQVDVPRIFVHSLPSRIPEGALRGGVAIVIDVLRATTSMAHALAAGCREIIPCAEIEEARAVADCVIPAGTALLAGERGGLPIEGFDLGNSPEEFTPEVCRDKTIVMTTSNGTRAILASLEADHVYVASFVNLAATVDEVLVQFLKKDHRHPIHIVCAGSEERPAVEDNLCAGALAKRLAEKSFEVLRNLGEDPFHDLAFRFPSFTSYERQLVGDDPVDNENGDSTNATKSIRMWDSLLMAHPPEEADGNRSPIVGRVLEWERGGQALIKIGREADIEAAAKIDTLDVVGKLGRKPTRISRV